MDFDIIEGEIIACVGLCVNDFNNETKDILLTNTNNVSLLEWLLCFNVRIHCVGCGESIMNRKDFGENVAFYDLAINLTIHKFDVIIDLKNKDTAHYQKLLKNNGILIVDLECLESNAIANKNANFNILMPFRLPKKFGEAYEKYYLFASNKFHPIADLSLQKLDLLDGLQYCNAKIYDSAFAMPNFVKNKLKAVVRN